LQLVLQEAPVHVLGQWLALRLHGPQERPREVALPQSTVRVHDRNQHALRVHLVDTLHILP